MKPWQITWQYAAAWWAAFFLGRLSTVVLPWGQDWIDWIGGLFK
jgi:hypothetical protein